MSAVFEATVIVYALGIAAVCTASAIAGRPRPRPVTPGLVILGLSAVTQAVVDVVALARGQHSPSMATHLGYLLTSVAVMPITAYAVRLDPGRWGSAALAVGCVLLTVVSLRLHQTVAGSRA
jgi:hypothetical protein